MAENTKIEWCDHTVNLWWGCTKVHAGCDNCYAEYLSETRYKNGVWGNSAPRKPIKSAFGKLKMMQEKAAKSNEVKTVFVGSMMDIFEKPMPLSFPYLSDNTGYLREMLFEKISAGHYNNLVFLFLTKRPSNINKYIPDSWKELAPKNVWFGTSPVDQMTYDNLILHMSFVKGNKFLSIEPQLNDIHLHSTEGIEWIIQGGESGHNRRPFDMHWASHIRMQCKDFGIKYFFKQIDKVKEIPLWAKVRELPDF